MSKADLHKLLFAETEKQRAEQRLRLLIQIMENLTHAHKVFVVTQTGLETQTAILWDEEGLPTLIDVITDSLSNMKEALALEAAKQSGQGPRFNS